MSTESTVSDPYAIVLADLKAQRNKIDAAIAAILALRPLSAHAQTAAPVTQPTTSAKLVPSEKAQAGSFAGMTIPDAAKLVIAEAGTPINNATILERLQARGMEFNAIDPLNTVGAVLSRRFNDVGDIVRVSRGTWGLKEWYPNDQTSGGKVEDAKTERATSGLEQLSAPTQPSVLD